MEIVDLTQITLSQLGVGGVFKNLDFVLITSAVSLHLISLLDDGKKSGHRYLSFSPHTSQHINLRGESNHTLRIKILCGPFYAFLKIPSIMSVIELIL